jgi:hypothetical protein
MLSVRNGVNNKIPHLRDFVTNRLKWFLPDEHFKRTFCLVCTKRNDVHAAI